MFVVVVVLMRFLFPHNFFQCILFLFRIKNSFKFSLFIGVNTFIARLQSWAPFQFFFLFLFYYCSHLLFSINRIHTVTSENKTKKNNKTNYRLLGNAFYIHKKNYRRSPTKSSAIFYSTYFLKGVFNFILSITVKFFSLQIDVCLFMITYLPFWVKHCWIHWFYLF